LAAGLKQPDREAKVHVKDFRIGLVADDHQEEQELVCQIDALPY
jgi:hypothetical protein